ncbi:MAG TPA: VCBS repeat-containing protein [Polyangia bacterium]|jgi:hypothetical protein|nr:VCBS repeat-containing protein [Polyangia bacterium]
MSKRVLFEVLILLSAVSCGARVTGPIGPGDDGGQEGAGGCGTSGSDVALRLPRCTDGTCPSSSQGQSLGQEQVCIYEHCLAAPPACQHDDQCADDTYCDEGRCIPYGLGPRCSKAPECTRPVVVGLFSPASKCRWSGSTTAYPDHKNVLSTPLVIDFNFDDDPRTLHPSIVFNSYNCIDGGCGDKRGCYGVIRIIDGATCRDQFSLALPEGTPGLIGDTTPAIGDVDGDGRPDVVATRQQGGVAGWRYDPAQKQFVEIWPMSYSDFNGGECHWDGLALHDLDDDGRPEILQASPSPAVYDQHGALVNGWPESIYYERGLFPVVADVDGDGQVEMVTGGETFRWNTAQRRWDMTWTSEGKLPRGQTALADFGRYGAEPAGDAPGAPDGMPEIVVIAAGTARIQTLAGRVLFGPLTLPKGGIGGPPTVADFDGDGHLEIGVAAARAYAVLDPDCVPGAGAGTGADAGTGGAERCASHRTDGVLWAQTSQDTSSSVTGSSVFDFDGDGRAEVVYADECFSRVYDGRTGRVLHSQPHTSCTWYENPVVADVDGDYKSEIIIPSNSNCHIICPYLDPVHRGVPCKADSDCPGSMRCVADGTTGDVGLCRCTTDNDCQSPTLACADPIDGPSSLGKVCRTRHPADTIVQGIEVLHDVLDRWVPSRAVWNQHAYNVTNINDDGTIPRTSKWQSNWKMTGLNNYRTNTQGQHKPLAAPDVTVHLRPPFSCSNEHGLRLQAEVCNRGVAPIGAGVPVTFYRGEPASWRVACKASTALPLDPGACAAVSCDDRNPPRTGYDLTVVADDDRGKGYTTECNEGNNRATLRGVQCVIIN